MFIIDAPHRIESESLAAANHCSFYIICPDNEVSSVEHARRIIGSVGDVTYDRLPWSRRDPLYADDSAAIKPD